MTAQMEANPTMFLDPDQSDTADNRLKTTFMGQGIYLMTSIFGVHVGPNGLIGPRKIPTEARSQNAQIFGFLSGHDWAILSGKNLAFKPRRRQACPKKEISASRRPKNRRRPLFSQKISPPAQFCLDFDLAFQKFGPHLSGFWLEKI